MLRSNELPFTVPAPLANGIDAYVDAYERNDWQIDMYKEILYQSAGTMRDNERNRLIDYYLHHGWEDGLEYREAT